MNNRVEVMHGVNFDVLGRREAAHYGGLTLPELEVRVKRFARDLGLEVSFSQTNHEGEFVEHLHRLPEIADASLHPAVLTFTLALAIVTGLVFGVEDLSGKFPVAADGTMNYPHLGAVRVAGHRGAPSGASRR